jgi:hypothetical protein
MNKPSQTDTLTRRLTAEEERLEATRARTAHWQRWGSPTLSYMRALYKYPQAGDA